MVTATVVSITQGFNKTFAILAILVQVSYKNVFGRKPHVYFTLSGNYKPMGATLLIAMAAKIPFFAARS